MADTGEGSEAPQTGNGWEVVSLTASAYDASPVPKEVNDDTESDSVGEKKGETYKAMFMSGHFVFPPSQHENSPLESEKTATDNEQGEEDTLPEFVAEKGGRSNAKDGENWDVGPLSVSEDFPGIQFVDTKNTSVGGTEFEEAMTLQGLNLLNEEQSLYSTVSYSLVQDEADVGGSTVVEESGTITEPFDLSEEGSDSDISLSPMPKVEDKDGGSDLSWEAWWKKRACSMYSHAKEANAVWTIVVAAAVMGLVILGQRLQHERYQILQQKCLSGINDEKMVKLLSPLSRLKEVIVGGQRRGISGSN